MITPTWRVLLIGGSSGTGKTRVAQALAQRYGISLILADDLRMAIQHVTIPDQHPDLHYFLTQPDVWHQPVDALVAGWISVAEVVSRAIEIVIGHHICVPDTGSIIIEGDGIVPSLAVIEKAAWCWVHPGDVRSIFLYEPDQAALLANMRQRGRGFGDLSVPEQERLAEGSWRFGQWLRSEAERVGAPALPSQPWDTLQERVLAMLGEEF